MLSDLRFQLCPKCGKLRPIGRGSGLCESCAAKRARDRSEKRDWAREYETRVNREDPRYRAFYRSKQWRMLSRSYAVEMGHKCEECGKFGTDVHHVVPIQTEEGWRRRFDRKNLRLLCVSCHNKAHGREWWPNRGDG